MGRRIVIKLDVPPRRQLRGPWASRSDPDFMAAYIVNHILGADPSRHAFTAVKRGLAYGISDTCLAQQTA
jgi:zinc protease